MDQENTNPLRFRRASSKLHKDPPQLNFRGLKSQQSNPSLKRHPSAPVYPRSHQQGGREHTRTRSNAYGSSSSSLEQNATGQSGSPSPGFVGTDPARTPYGTRLSFNDRNSDDLIGTPFDARGMLNVLEEAVPDGDHQQPASSVAAAESMSSYRPPTLQTSYSSPEPRGLRQSASFTALHARTDTALPPIQDLASYSKRNSDETPGAKPKKKTISSFVNSMLGSPRNIKISAPENPVHVTHVGYDNQTGQFTVSSKSHKSTPHHLSEPLISLGL